MIDRSYLPYKAAREYVDRGMAKWMGFFISEHSSALSHKKNNTLIQKNSSFLPQRSNQKSNTIN